MQFVWKAALNIGIDGPVVAFRTGDVLVLDVLDIIQIPDCGKSRSISQLTQGNSRVL